MTIKYGRKSVPLPPHGALARAKECEIALRIGVEDSAALVRPEAVAQAHKERSAQLGFEQAQARRYRRRGQAKQRCGCLAASFAVHRDKGFEVAPVH